MKKAILCLGLGLLICSCAADGGKGGEKFQSWNSTAKALTTLKDFVAASIDEKNANFIPKKDRLAVFDMDGTLYAELYPSYLEYQMYEYRVLVDETYKNKATEEQKVLANEIHNNLMKNDKGEYVDTHGNFFPSGTDMRHARLAAQAYAGMTVKEFKEYCREYLKKEVPMFNNMTYGSAFYLPMKEVVTYLQDNDYSVYVVSGSDRFLCRELVCDYLNIAPDHIIGMDVALKATHQGDTPGVSYTFQNDDEVIRTDEVLVKNLKFNKVAQICQEIGQQPVLSFGNSGGDQAMHVYTLTDNPHPSAAFMLVADDDQRDYAVTAKTADYPKKWSDLGFNVVSMRDDFATIYGTNVTKRLVA